MNGGIINSITRLHVVGYFYRVSINSFPDYKHLLEENYVEYRHFLPLLKLVSEILCHVFIVCTVCPTRY